MAQNLELVREVAHDHYTIQIYKAANGYHGAVLYKGDPKNQRADFNSGPTVEKVHTTLQAFANMNVKAEDVTAHAAEIAKDLESKRPVYPDVDHANDGQVARDYLLGRIGAKSKGSNKEPVSRISLREPSEAKEALVFEREVDHLGQNVSPQVPKYNDNRDLDTISRIKKGTSNG